MKIFFSNKNLWNTYFKISIFVSVFLLLLLFLVYHSFILVILILLCAGTALYAGYQVSLFYKKIYLEIDHNELLIYSPIQKNLLSLRLKQVKNLRKSGQNIIFVTDEQAIFKIKLIYMNGTDTKRLINFLKYHPAIKNKKFFV